MNCYICSGPCECGYSSRYEYSITRHASGYREDSSNELRRLAYEVQKLKEDSYEKSAKIEEIKKMLLKIFDFFCIKSDEK